MSGRLVYVGDVSHNEFKWGLLGSGIWPGVEGILGKGELAPVGLMVISEDML